MKRLLLAAISSLALFAPISFAEPLKVITSFSILEDLAENIGKDKVTVESIIQRDQDAHSFEPTPKDILKIQNADVVILNGAGFDNWLARILTANKYEGVIIDTSQNVPLLAYGDHKHDHDHDHDHDHGEFDPHIWQNPENVIIMTQNIEAGLSLASPEDASYFSNNFNQYKLELEAADQYAKAKLNLNTEPHLMVLHHSFGYLAAHYDLHFVAVSNINPLAEPSAKKMAELYQLVIDENIRAIFSENIAPSRFITTLAKDLKLDNGGILYSDALTKIAPANTYLGMFKYNIDQIAKVLENASKE